MTAELSLSLLLLFLLFPVLLLMLAAIGVVATFLVVLAIVCKAPPKAVGVAWQLLAHGVLAGA